MMHESSFTDKGSVSSEDISGRFQRHCRHRCDGYGTAERHHCTCTSCQMHLPAQSSPPFSGRPTLPLMICAVTCSCHDPSTLTRHSSSLPPPPHTLSPQHPPPPPPAPVAPPPKTAHIPAAVITPPLWPRTAAVHSFNPGRPLKMLPPYVPPPPPHTPHPKARGL